MGHLTRVANDVVNAQEKGENIEAIKALVKGIVLWLLFVVPLFLKLLAYRYFVFKTILRLVGQYL